MLYPSNYIDLIATHFSSQINISVGFWFSKNMSRLPGTEYVIKSEDLRKVRTKTIRLYLESERRQFIFLGHKEKEGLGEFYIYWIY